MTRLVFLHIGRTGGTTLAGVLERQYGRGHTFHVDSARLDESLAELAALPREARERVRLLSGHVAFGVHELLPEPVAYVTLLRDPVARLASHYRYVLRRPDHRLHAVVASRRPSFREYLAAGLSPELDNWQTRVLAGDVDTPVGECGPELLERAKRNAERWFAVVGLLERFDETLTLCRRTLGWRLPLYVRRNALPGGPALAPEDAQAALAASRLDAELYAWAAERLAERIAAEPGFARDLRAFRIANAAYAPWGRLRALADDARHRRRIARTYGRPGSALGDAA